MREEQGAGELGLLFPPVPGDDVSLMTMGASLLDGGHARDVMNPWDIIIYYHYLPVLPGLA